MAKRTVFCVLAGMVMLVATTSFGQSNARTAALGSPGVDGRNLIDDVSDIFYFPSEVAASTDMAQGVAANYVYASKSFLDFMSFGFLMNKGNYSTLSGFYNGYTGAATAASLYDYEVGVTGQPVAPNYGAFDIAPIAAPPGVAHALLGMRLGEVVKLGLDLSYESSNASVDSTGVTITGIPPAATTTTERGVGTSSLSALGVNAGVQLDISKLKIKAGLGFVNLGYSATMEHSGNQVAPAPTPIVTYVTETSEMNATKGTYIPLSAKASLDLGTNVPTFGADFVMSNYQFEATFNDGDPATVPNQTFKSNEVATTAFGIGIGDEFKATDATKFIASAAFTRSATVSTPVTVSEAAREITTTTTTLPYFSLGIEHIEKSVWKFDQVALRAGGSKSIGWTSRTETGGTATSEVSNPQTGVNWTWQTGLGLTMGRFDLGMTVATGNWNGVYFLTGTGPAGANVTLTYNFGSGSSSPASSSEPMGTTPAMY